MSSEAAQERPEAGLSFDDRVIRTVRLLSHTYHNVRERINAMGQIILCPGCMREKQQRPTCEHCGYDERRRNASHQLSAGTELTGKIKSADARDTAAMYHIGYMYDNGCGVAQDYAAAIEWYRKAADAGHKVAMNNIGYMYEHGDGVTVDYVKAREWYQNAAELGDPDAQSALDRMDREGI